MSFSAQPRRTAPARFDMRSEHADGRTLCHGGTPAAAPRIQRGLALGCLVAAFCSCGGGPSRSASATPAAPAPNLTEVAPQAAPPLTPVAAPRDVVGRATLRKPSHLLETSQAWLGMNGREALQNLLQSTPLAPVADLIDYEASVNALVTLDPNSKSRPRLFGAAALGLTSRQAALDAFRAAARPVEFVEPGVHSVGLDAQRLCFVASALGAAPARLICANDRESLDLLGGYLARGDESGLPEEFSGSKADLHVEILAEPAYRVFGSKAELLKLLVPTLMAEISVGDIAFDTAMENAATAIVDDALLELGDLAKLNVEATAQRAAMQLDLAVHLEFHDQRSWLPHWGAELAQNAGPPPEAFWKLPADATQASHSQAPSGELYEGMRESLIELGETGLAYWGASPKAQRVPASLLQRAEWGPTVSARGSVTVPETTSEEGAQLHAALGYILVGVGAPFEKTRSMIDDLLTVFEDAPLREAVSKRRALDLSQLPPIRQSEGPEILGQSRRYELSLALDAGGPPLVISLLVVGDGPRSWLGVSANRSELESHMAALIGSPPAATRLASRADLSALRTQTGTAAGYWTLGALARQVLSTSQEVAAALDDLGDAPVTWRFFGRANAPALHLEAQVPAELLKNLSKSGK